CWAPDGRTLYASGGEFEGVHAFAFEDGLLAPRKLVRVAGEEEKLVPRGLAPHREGKTPFAAGTRGHPVAQGPLADPEKRSTITLGKASYPYACLPEPGGKRLFVSLWGKGAVAVVDLDRGKLAGTWPTESHPTEMALSPDGKALFVACANST